jgi:hypothetical protein
VIAGTDPARPTAMAVDCPLYWCKARPGVPCNIQHGRLDYHAQRFADGLKVEFPNHERKNDDDH